MMVVAGSSKEMKEREARVWCKTLLEWACLSLLTLELLPSSFFPVSSCSPLLHLPLLKLYPIFLWRPFDLINSSSVLPWYLKCLTFKIIHTIEFGLKKQGNTCNIEYNSNFCTVWRWESVKSVKGPPEQMMSREH